ncbi:hypothetical protein C8Q80DRAFT_1274803 [Daedaleopsis nitida]|nr:hypothetical protein C8Q80DRAFT_1274803 [Daedaleopsis nitida]
MRQRYLQDILATPVFLAASFANPIAYPLQVHRKDLWPVIGAKLCFVNFPGTDTEPARAGPALAAHLKHSYKEFLLECDQQFMKQL